MLRSAHTLIALAALAAATPAMAQDGAAPPVAAPPVAEGRTDPRTTGPVALPTRPEFTVGTALEATDNIDLSPSGQKDGALIWTQTGQLRWVRLGTRLSGAIDSAVAYDSIFGREGGGVDHEWRITGNARARAEILDDLFFLDAQALSRRALTAPDAQLSATGAGGRGTTQVTSLSVSPFLAHRFGTYGDAELRYRFKKVFVGESSVGDLQTHAGSARITTGTFLSRQRHALLASVERTEAEVATSEIDRTAVLLDSEFQITDAIAALTTLGWESVRSPALTEDLRGIVALAGVRLLPRRGASIEVRAGRRYEATILDADAQYTLSPRLALTATYEEGIQAPQQALTGVDLRYDEQLDAFIDEATELPVERDDVGTGLASSVYRFRRFQAGVVGTYPRDRFRLTATFGERSFDLGADELLWGASAQWAHRLTRRLSSTATATYRGSETQGPDGRTDTLVLGVGANYQLTERTYVLVSLRRAQRWAERAGAGYIENAIVAGLQVKF